MNHEFLDLKLFGPQELAPLIKKYRKLKEATKPAPKKPIAVVKTRWPEMQ
jgi:hypothetical protein